MHLKPVQDILLAKLERESNIKGLQSHANGYFRHVGKISPGCRSCVSLDRFANIVVCGNSCNAECPYCITDVSQKDLDESARKKYIRLMDINSLKSDYSPRRLAFSGGGEPLLYMEEIKNYMEHAKHIESETGRKPWYNIYTNGMLAEKDTLDELKDLGFDEIRFHLSASGFSEKVYENIANASERISTVTVENPSWPPDRMKLFDMLGRLDGLGVKHLNIDEIQVGPENHDNILSAYPEAVFYYMCGTYLYDGGLVYDIIEEVLSKGYKYSVLNCDSLLNVLKLGFIHKPYLESCKGLFQES